MKNKFFIFYAIFSVASFILVFSGAIFFYLAYTYAPIPPGAAEEYLPMTQMQLLLEKISGLIMIVSGAFLAYLSYLGFRKHPGTDIRN